MKFKRQFQEKLKMYAPLIGSWDFDWVGHKEDGSTWTVPGEWHFACQEFEEHDTK